MPTRNRRYQENLIATAATLVVGVAIVLVVFGCAPSVEDFLGPGLDCKADITMPEERPTARPGTTVSVDVKIHGCKSAVPKLSPAK